MIALDFGLKRIGVAWHCKGIILPLEAIEFRNVSQVICDVQDTLNNKSPKILLIGIVKEELQIVLDSVLKGLDFSGEIVFIDENLTSQEASFYINGRKNSKKLRKDGTLDSLSAMIILERYLKQSIQNDKR